MSQTLIAWSAVSLTVSAKERMDALRRRLIVPNDHTLPLEQEASIRSLMAEVKVRRDEWMALTCRRRRAWTE